jgi:pyruvate formate lyase activating enzyme
LLNGVVGDIREFTVHDGPGIRTTVFLKGCPLRCSWCHNPEMISPLPQTICGSAGERIVGRQYSSTELASILQGQAEILSAGGGGVTFSGGEPLMQADFLMEVIGQLEGLHLLLDTSGYADAAAFSRVAAACDLVYFDLKLIDDEKHLEYTGGSNEAILNNLRLLTKMPVPFVVRVPLVPGVTDTAANLAAIARTVRGAPNLEVVELLPYNRAAGGKYAGLGMLFEPGFDEGLTVNADPRPFLEAGLRVKVAGEESDGQDGNSG